VLAGGIRAMAKASLDQVAAKVAIHAVVRSAGRVAGVSGRIDLHMHMATLTVVAAFTRREQLEVASNDDAYSLLRIVAEFDGRTGYRPDDFQGGPAPRMEPRSG
jgi:hypothetical protein